MSSWIFTVNEETGNMLAKMSKKTKQRRNKWLLLTPRNQVDKGMKY